MFRRPASQVSTTPTAVDHANTTSSPDSNGYGPSRNGKEKRPSVAATRPVSSPTDYGRPHVLFYDAPPSLDYTIKTRSRERAIIVWSTLIFIESCILPLILFYSLYWGAHLSTTKNLAIITSLIGTVSGFKFAQRMWFLWFQHDHVTRRPIGVGRWGVDFFQFILSLAMAAFFIPLIIGSSVTPGSPRITAMALPCVMLVLTLPLLVTGLFPYRVRVPWRVSSFPHHQPLPPLGYCYVEDIVAVDGGGCTQFRQAWRTRYEESHVIRHLVRQVSVAWGISGLVVAAGLLAACWCASVDTGYGLGYSIPWLWALLMAAATIVRTRRELEREKREWVKGVGKEEEGEVHRARTLMIMEGRWDPPALPVTVDEATRKSLDARRSREWKRRENEGETRPQRVHSNPALGTPGGRVVASPVSVSPTSPMSPPLVAPPPPVVPAHSSGSFSSPGPALTQWTTTESGHGDPASIARQQQQSSLE